MSVANLADVLARTHFFQVTAPTHKEAPTEDDAEDIEEWIASDNGGFERKSKCCKIRIAAKPASLISKKRQLLLRSMR
jgi:hypothetical protein